MNKTKELKMTSDAFLSDVELCGDTSLCLCLFSSRTHSIELHLRVCYR